MKTIPLAALVLAMLAGGCGVSADSALKSSTAPAARGATTPQASSFTAWRSGFRARALTNGIRPEVFDSAFSGVGPNNEVLRLDGAQAEFTKPIWEYLDSAASASRIATGRSKSGEWGKTLAAIESRYGVDAQVVVAIWGMETNYGANRGSIPVIESLATLAWQGRRRDFGEEQLIAALKILQAGDTTPAALRGSWAGAMGHTQFIPVSYLDHAVDFTGDGRRDIWSNNPTDALASTANYLKKSGWQHGRPWGIEVRLPQGFNYATADQSNKRKASEWRKRGVTAINGGPLPDHGPAAIIAPAGARGPAFAIYNNFFVIKKYNNATSYAIGVGHLGDRIAGGGPFKASWPRGERSLSRTEKVEMQTLLTAKGFDTGSTDGIIGPDTIGAIRRYQATQGLTPDGFANASLLARLR